MKKKNLYSQKTKPNEYDHVEFLIKSYNYTDIPMCTIDIHHFPLHRSNFLYSSVYKSTYFIGFVYIFSAILI